MGEPLRAPPGRDGARGRTGAGSEVLAALDLGTNNCRLLIATPAGRGFRIVDAYSRIVRLGEGLSQTGVLNETAMQRALAALAICASKIARRGATRVRAVATQACRSARNGPEFIERVRAATGLDLAVISAREEARLAVAGCLNLLDRTSSAALVLDVGGGSTELSWLDLTTQRERDIGRPTISSWLSIPIGVVTLAERFPQEPGADLSIFRAMVDHVKAELSAFTGADHFRPAFAEGRAHLVGTSGAITSLAGLHLGLPRYERAKVDGLWMTRAECEAVARRLAGLSVAERGAEPCIGPDRADLVLAGAAILEAVQELWPCDRVRVADRGLREGLLMALMSERGAANPRRQAPATR